MASPLTGTESFGGYALLASNGAENPADQKQLFAAFNICKRVGGGGAALMHACVTQFAKTCFVSRMPKFNRIFCPVGTIPPRKGELGQKTTSEVGLFLSISTEQGEG
jgi:hypothetical protein